MPAAAPKSSHRTGKLRQVQAGFTQGRSASPASPGEREKLGAARPPGPPAPMCLTARTERTPGLPPSPPRRGGAGRAASLPSRASVSRAPSPLPALRSAHTDLGTAAAAPGAPAAAAARAHAGAAPHSGPGRGRGGGAAAAAAGAAGAAAWRGGEGEAGGRAGPGGRVSSSCSCVGRAALSASPAPPSWDNADVGAAQARGARGGPREGRRERGREDRPCPGVQRGRGRGEAAARYPPRATIESCRAAPSGRVHSRRRPAEEWSRGRACAFVRARWGPPFWKKAARGGGAGRARGRGGAGLGAARAPAQGARGEPREGRPEGSGQWLWVHPYTPVHTRTYTCAHSPIRIYKHIQI